MDSVKELKNKMTQVIRAYHHKGWSPATSTNYSFRQHPQANTLFVSRSGIDKSLFEDSDFIEVDFAGNPTPAYAGIKPSAETLIHCVLYQLFPKLTVILHSHSVYSVLNSQKYDDRIFFSGYEIQKGFAGQHTHENQIAIPILENTQDMRQFAEDMKARQAEFGNHSFVIRNHGTYAWGEDLFAAKRHLETLEYLLEVNWKLKHE